jgi:hypothetical protein
MFSVAARTLAECVVGEEVCHCYYHDCYCCTIAQSCNNHNSLLLEKFILKSIKFVLFQCKTKMMFKLIDLFDFSCFFFFFCSAIASAVIRTANETGLATKEKPKQFATIEEW